MSTLANKMLIRFLRRDVALPNHPTRGTRGFLAGTPSPFPDRFNVDQLEQESPDVLVSLTDDPDIVSAGEPVFLIGNSGVTVGKPTSTGGIHAGSSVLRGLLPGENPRLFPLPNQGGIAPAQINRQDGTGRDIAGR